MNSDNGRAPAFSVLIASWSGETALRRCLESLIPQIGDEEVIVAFGGGRRPALSMEERFGNVRFISAPADATVFQLRAAAVHAARGRSIAMVEDHSVVSSGWLQSLMSARTAGALICGGPIENDSESSGYDWALYFAEYGRFMPPVQEGEVSVLSGANISYDREMLWTCHSIWESSFYESDVNAALTDAGHQLRMIPHAIVTARIRMRLIEATKHLFDGGVHFGNFRATRSQSFARFLWLIASVAIPFVTLFRIVRAVVARRPQRLLPLLRSSLPLIMLLCAWSLGEAVGYLKPRER